MSRVAFAVAAHPDDIEFMMAGTLILLKEAGYEIHYMNVANGSCGTTQYDTDEIVRIRRQEAIDACRLIGAHFHDSLVPDIEIFYNKTLLGKLGAVMRDVAPDILLIQPTSDYMEDHMISARLAVTAAFCRTMRNFPTDPPRDPVFNDVSVYHALPYGLDDALRRPVTPGMFIDVSSVIDRKERMLNCHQSQKTWLDESQGLDSYLITMRDMSRTVGGMSGRFEYAEGFTRHSHLGFCAEDADPLADVLGDKVRIA